MIEKAKEGHKVEVRHPDDDAVSTNDLPVPVAKSSAEVVQHLDEIGYSRPNLPKESARVLQKVDSAIAE